MKSVLVSIQPKWCEKIANGVKTIEVRKSAPKEVPFKCYIYCTKGSTLWSTRNFMDVNGKVIGEFICDKVYEFYRTRLSKFVTIKDCAELSYSIADNQLAKMCLSYDDVIKYGKGKTLYGWYISDLKIYDKPRELSEFRKTRERIAQTCGCLSNNGLCTAAKYEELCDNIEKCCFKTPTAPQSWQYVEELC